MRYRALLYSAFILLISAGYSQTNFGINTSANRFFTHTDNDLPITELNDWSSGIGFNIYYQRPFTPKITARVSIGFNSGKIDQAQQFTRTDFLGTVISTNPVSISLNLFPADVSIITPLSNWLTLGIGPSFSWTTRTTSYFLNSTGEGDPFKDRLAGLGFGAHGFLEAIFVFNEDSKMFVTAQINLRYMSALALQEEGRLLQDYELTYLQGGFLLGVGWKL
ncbi:MAG: hypothetical protein AAFP70_09515 [Calditrichota bacterium]